MNWLKWIQNNGSYKVVALFITLVLWISVLGRKEETADKYIDIEYKLRSNRAIKNTVVDQIMYKVAGSRRSLTKYMEEDLEPIIIDLTDASLGRRVIQTPTEGIVIPFGTKIVSVNPKSIIVDIDELIVKKIPVKLTWSDTSPEEMGYKLVSINPEKVKVAGVRDSLSLLQHVLTESIELDILEQNKNHEDGLTIDIRIREINKPGIKELKEKQVQVLLERVL